MVIMINLTPSEDSAIIVRDTETFELIKDEELRSCEIIIIVIMTMIILLLLLLLLTLLLLLLLVIITTIMIILQ